MKTYQVNKEGYYGEFGGAYIPEILHRCVEELQNAYSKVLESEGFKQEFHQLLRDYVGRPSPLYLANRLSKKYGCKIYLKREDLNHTGAHKINNAIGQVLLAKRMGKKRIIAETGAGQHGVATATVCALMNMQCIVYMGKTDVERQHINVEKMKMLGAEVRPVTSGNMTLKDATNEAIRDWCCHPADTYYVIGSTVGPHPYPDMVARLQSVISEEIKKHVHIPVATVARINEPWIAEELIANGKTDICMIGRPNLCDSEFANKAYAGKAEDIRPCIGCGRCLNGIMFGKPISCTVNPSVETNAIEKATEKKKVLVIGGGPAGMEAAYVAKKRGHEVVLCEKSNELGGLLRIAAVPISKQELCKVIKFMARRLQNEGIEVRMNCEVTPEMLETEFKDYEVVCSIGAKPKEIESFKQFKQTMTADDILAGRTFPGRKIVILGGGSVGCETADYLAPLINDLFPANRDVTILEMTPSLMTGEGGAAKSQLTQRLMRKGVKIELNSQVTKVDENTITYVKEGVEHHIDDADTLVFAVGYIPLKMENERANYIGDCDKVGNLKDAIGAAYQLAKTL